MFPVSLILDIVCQKLSDYGGVYHSARREVVVIVKHRCCCLLDKIANKDECATDNGGCSHECIDTDGSFRCGCPEDMILSDDLRTCVSIAGKVKKIIRLKLLI